jgi:muconolactone D-isomerase
MLYHVRKDVQVLHDVDADRSERLKAEEKACAQDLQRRGK